MKKNILYIVVYVILATLPLQAWGVEGHKLVTKKALEALSPEFAALAPYFTEICDKCIDPDTRKDIDKTEGIKHYIDIDFYKEYRQGTMIMDKAELEKIYTPEKVNRMGVLPWAVIQTYNNLVSAFKEGNKEQIIRMLADLGHYIGDAHQPMHTIMNYNGQLSNQTGIHERYESVTIEKFYVEINDKVTVNTITPLTDVKPFIFEIIQNSNILSPSLFYADSIIVQEHGKSFDEHYYNTFWMFTKSVTISQLSKASEALASFYKSAWIAAGKPSLSNLK